MEACVAQEVPGGSADIPRRVRVAVRLTHVYCSPPRLLLRYELPGTSDDFYISTSNHHVYEAFVGMFCLVRQDSSRRLAPRTQRVAGVLTDASGIPLWVGVLYVDSGRTDVVALGCLYSGDAEAAAEPQKAVACCVRSVKPTDASSRFDLTLLWKQSTLFEAVFHATSDAGVYEVYLYAKCPDKESLMTHDVRKYLAENGFAEQPVNYLGVGNKDSAQGVVGVYHHNSGEGKQNGTLERPSSLLTTCSEPTGDIRLLPGDESSVVTKEK